MTELQFNECEARLDDEVVAWHQLAAVYERTLKARGVVLNKVVTVEATSTAVAPVVAQDVPKASTPAQGKKGRCHRYGVGT